MTYAYQGCGCQETVIPVRVIKPTVCVAMYSLEMSPPLCDFMASNNLLWFYYMHQRVKPGFLEVTFCLKMYVYPPLRLLIARADIDPV